MKICCRTIALGILAGLVIDLIVARVWLSCMDAQDWP